MSEQFALILDDQSTWQSILTEILSDLGFQTDVCSTLPEAKILISQKSHRIAIVDLSLEMSDPNDQSGLTALDYIRQHDPSCQAIILSGYATVPVAVSAMKDLGAFTCLQKENFKREEFVGHIHQALNLPPRVGIRQSDSVQPATSADVHPKPSMLHEPRVLVVDDDAGWIEVLEEIVQDAGFEAATCQSYGEALSLIQKSQYQLVILDLRLSGKEMQLNTTEFDAKSGYFLLEQLRNTKTAVIVVSGEASPREINRLIEKYPIFAFIEKQTFQRQRTIEQIRLAMNLVQDSFPELEMLTQREKELFDLLTKGYSNQQIADELLISLNTVKRHTKAIFRKLGIHSRAAAVALKISKK